MDGEATEGLEEGTGEGQMINCKHIRVAGYSLTNCAGKRVRTVSSDWRGNEPRLEKVSTDGREYEGWERVEGCATSDGRGCEE